MHYTELLTIWDPIFKKMGYRETAFNNWVSQMEELVIVLCLRVQDKEKDFFLDIGILFKKRHSYELWEAPAFDDHDVGQGLYLLLKKSGEWEYYLNNLFSYDSAINTYAEMTNNSRELARLFLTKVMPLIDQLDDYASQAEDFDKETTWKPLVQHFYPNWKVDKYFLGALVKYYRRG
jgi:hypothetical protein